MNRYLIFALLILFLIPYSNPVIADESETYTIIYDEGHRQFFDHSLLVTAFSRLNQTFDQPNLDVTVNLVINHGKFNSTNLQGADLLIVSNPGDGTNVDVATEPIFIEQFVDNRGSVLFLSNPFSFNNSISANVDPMNDLIFGGMDLSIKQGNADDNENSTVIIDDFNNDGNASHVVLGNGNINSDVLFEEVHDLSNSNILYFGTSLDFEFVDRIFGNASASAYSVNQEYTPLLDEFGEARWIAGTDFSGENGGRGLVLGSTIMFSDLDYDSSTKWIEQESNHEFFENIVAWLLEITPLNKPQPTVTDDFGVLFGVNLLGGLVLTGLLILVVFGYLLYSGNMKVTDILKVRMPRPSRIRKSKSTKKAKATPKKATKKPSKKRRKRT